MHDPFGVDQSAKTVKMLFVHDPAVISVLQGGFAKLTLDLLFQFGNERILDRTLAQDMIWGHTGLPTVEVFTERDALCRKRNIGTCIYDTGALTAKLQHAGREMLGSVAQDLLANGSASRKEDHIKSVMAKKYPDYGFIGFPEGIAELYIEIGKKYNIRGDLAFAQAVKETGYFQFYGIVRNGQNNFCGLGATGKLNTGEELQNGVDPERAVYIPGTHGITFGTMADGVEAHIQHLYAYATKDPLPEGIELVDPRFKYVTRGIAPLWTGLNGRWAVPGNGYGESIIGDYWFEALILESN